MVDMTMIINQSHSSNDMSFRKDVRVILASRLFGPPSLACLSSITIKQQEDYHPCYGQLMRD